MNEDLEFKVYSRRWDKYDIYKLTHIPTGWGVRHIVINGECDKQGNPYLYKNFRQDFISYPHDLPDLLEILWDAVEENNLTKQELQERINDLAEWVSKCEGIQPSYSGYY